MQASLISAAVISAERLYSSYWPFNHRTLTMRAYRIIIFIFVGADSTYQRPPQYHRSLVLTETFYALLDTMRLDDNSRHIWL